MHVNAYSALSGGNAHVGGCVALWVALQFRVQRCGCLSAWTEPIRIGSCRTHVIALLLHDTLRENLLSSICRVQFACCTIYPLP